MNNDEPKVTMPANSAGVFRDGQFVEIKVDRPQPLRRELPRVPRTSALAYVEAFSTARRKRDD